jgi:hypothetical protein
LTNDTFTFRDIIILQDPNNIEKHIVKNFDFIKNNLSIPKNEENKIEDLIN